MLSEEIKILVLNEYSFSTSTVCDAALERAFTRTESVITARQFIASPRYNNLLNLKAQLAKFLNFSTSDICNNDFSKTESDDLEHTADSLALTKALRFYAPGEQTVFDADFICNFFDLILFCPVGALSGDVLNDTLVSLLASEKCPGKIMMNVKCDDIALLEALACCKNDEPPASVAQKRMVRFLSESMQSCVAVYLHAKTAAYLQACPELLSKEMTVLPTLLDHSLLFHKKDILLSLLRCFNLCHGAQTGAQEDSFSLHAAAYESRCPMAPQLNANTLVEEMPEDTLDENEDDLDEESYFTSSCSLATASVGKPVSIGLASAFLYTNRLSPLDFRGARRILDLKLSFPESKISLILNDNYYSHLNELPDQAVVFSDAIADAAENTLSLASYAQRHKGRLNPQFTARLNTILVCMLKAWAEIDVTSPYAALYEDLKERAPDQRVLIQDCDICLDLDDFVPEHFDMIVSDQPEVSLVARQNRIPVLDIDDAQASLFFKEESEQDDFTEFLCHFGACLADEGIEYEYRGAEELVFMTLLNMDRRTQAEEQQLHEHKEMLLDVLDLHDPIEEELLEDATVPRGLPSWNSDCYPLIEVDFFTRDQLHALHKHINETFFSFVHSLGLAVSVYCQRRDEQREPQTSALTRIVQRSNYTKGDRYNKIWNLMSFYAAALHPEDAQVQTLAHLITCAEQQRDAIFIPHSLEILSFGCSCGDEIFDLMHFFPQQNFTGVDINRDALARAEKTLALYKEKDPDAHVRFLHSSTFVQEQTCFDVITAMTVLCRHPEASRSDDAREIYPFADFEATVEALDARLKKGGLLCIYNANYRFTDTAVAKRYRLLATIVNDTKEAWVDTQTSLAEYAELLKAHLPLAQQESVTQACAFPMPKDALLAAEFSGVTLAPHVRIFEPEGCPAVPEHVGFLFYKVE